MEDPGLATNTHFDQGNESHESSAERKEGLGASAPQLPLDSQPRQAETTLTAAKENIGMEAYYDSDEQGFRKIVRNFTPSWFIITMGTGVVSILLHQLPYNGHWLGIISVIFFVLNVVLFVTFSFISCVRYIAYPELFGAVLRHPHQSLFLGTFPVGLATIINMIVLVCFPAWGYRMVTLAWVLWWIDGVIALAICFHMTFIIMSNRRSDAEKMTALWFIPIVSVVIIASSGGIIAAVLSDPQQKLLTLIISYVLWSIGVPLSFVILVIYFYRLATHEPPPREVIVSLFLPVGPLGLASFSIIQFGKVARKLFPETHSLPAVPRAGDSVYVFGFMVGLILWGFAIIWGVIAAVMIVQARRFPFNMGWWGFVFPIGIFTLSTITIGNELESRFFKVLGTVLTVIVLLLWIVCAIGTVLRSIGGTMLHAPCLHTDKKLMALKMQKIAAKTSTEKMV